MLTLDDFINEMLSIEKVEIKKPTFIERVHNFAKRRDIEKQLQDEQIAENERVLKLGKKADEFLNSSYYRDLIFPHIKSTLKTGFQKLMLNYDTMTESQLKAELAVIRKTWDIQGKLKLIRSNAESLGERLNAKV